jgi:hypothetical protein
MISIELIAGENFPCRRTHLGGDKVGLEGQRCCSHSLGEGKRARRGKRRRRMETPTYSCTSLATTRTVVIFQGTNDFIAGVGDRERARQRASRRHGAYVSLSLSMTVSLCRTACWFVRLVLSLWGRFRRGCIESRRTPERWICRSSRK